MLFISSVQEMSQLKWHIKIDEYLPVSCRSYEGTLGVNYVRVGNFNSSLLEFLVEPPSLTIRGFTLTAFDKKHEPTSSLGLPTTYGLPVIAPPKPDAFQGPADARRLDIPEEFSVGIGADYVEIDLCHISKATRVIKSGVVEFYIDIESLVGLRVLDLSIKKISLLKTHGAM